MKVSFNEGEFWKREQGWEHRPLAGESYEGEGNAGG